MMHCPHELMQNQSVSEGKTGGVCSEILLSCSCAILPTAFRMLLSDSLRLPFVNPAGFSVSRLTRESGSNEIFSKVIS